jgi:hypothetical protein
MSVYPNPARELFYVSGNVKNLQNLSIYNLSGQKVMEVENPAEGKGVNISLLNKGMYFITMKSSDGVVSTLRLVKQ